VFAGDSWNGRDDGSQTCSDQALQNHKEAAVNSRWLFDGPHNEAGDLLVTSASFENGERFIVPRTIEEPRGKCQNV
jgi:hypothetical protein